MGAKMLTWLPQPKKKLLSTRATRDKAHARENFRKFLDLWKNADPDIPEVEDAKKSLAGLKGT